MISIDQILYENSNQCQMIRVSCRLSLRSTIKLIMNYTLLFTLIINNWRHSHITEGLNSFDITSYGVQRIVCNVRFQFDGVSLYLGKLFTG